MWCSMALGNFSGQQTPQEAADLVWPVRYSLGMLGVVRHQSCSRLLHYSSLRPHQEHPCAPSSHHEPKLCLAMTRAITHRQACIYQQATDSTRTWTDRRSGVAVQRKQGAHQAINSPHAEGRTSLHHPQIQGQDNVLKERQASSGRQRSLLGLLI